MTRISTFGFILKFSIFESRLIDYNITIVFEVINMSTIYARLIQPIQLKNFDILLMIILEDKPYPHQKNFEKIITNKYILKRQMQ